jgi:hypothetical protein
MSGVGGDTNPGGAPWTMSPPPTCNTLMRHFEMHPVLISYYKSEFCKNQEDNFSETKMLPGFFRYMEIEELLIFILL